MKVFPPKWPRVPVAAPWQQSSRGAKNLPDDLLPTFQVPKKKTASTSHSVSSTTVTRRVRTTQNTTMTKATVETSTERVKSRSSSTINIGTWNVRTLKTAGHWEMLLEESRRFNVDILGLCETHLTDKDNMFNKDEYTILLSSRKDGICREGVGLLISQPLLQCLESFDAVSPRIVTAKFKMKEGILNVIQVYAPTSTHSETESDEFYDTLQFHIQKVNKKEKLIVMGDLNAKIGKEHRLWTPTVGRFGLGDLNSRGEKLLEFCTLHKLAICNTFFQHKDSRKYTWTSPCGRYRNMIDFIITQQDNMSNILNCRSYCSADIGSDHNLVLAKLSLQPTKTKRIKSLPKRFAVSRLSNATIAHEFQAKIGGAFEPLIGLVDTEVEEIWSTFKDTTNRITEEIVGLKKARHIKGLPEEVMKACDQRRKARISMFNNPSESNRSAYSKLNKNVKWQVKQWKRKLLETEITEMEEDHAKNDSHQLFKRVKKLAGEKENIPAAAKDKNGTLKTAPGEVMECWQKYFDNHLNTEFPRDEEVLNSIPDAPIGQPSQPFSLDELVAAVKKLKNNKACGLDRISAETIKAGGAPMNQLLLHIINTAWTQGKVPEDWSAGLITPVFKKGDKLDPGNYRAITLLSIPGKVFCRMILNRIQDTIEDYLTEEQCGFRRARGTSDAVFIARQIFEKAKERRVPIHWNFVDFKAAFDTIWREALWKCLRSIGVESKMVNLIETMYEQTKCAIIVNGKMSEWFKVGVGVRQGCLLSPALFNLFLEFVMKGLRQLDSGVQMGNTCINNIRYADDTTLLDLVFEKLQVTTDELDKACKKWGMKINPAKCKIMTDDPRDITLNNIPIEKVKEFVFLGSNIPSVEEDVKRRTRLAAWSFGRLKNSIWTNHDISRSLKIRIYKSLILPIATYGSESWTLRKSTKQKLEVFEMRCLRSILGVSLRDKMRNVDIRRQLDMNTTITDVVTKRRLKWFGHVIRMPACRLPNQAYHNDFDTPRQRGRPPLRWKDQIKDDAQIPLPEAELLATTRLEWRRLSKEAREHTVLSI